MTKVRLFSASKTFPKGTNIWSGDIGIVRVTRDRSALIAALSDTAEVSRTTADSLERIIKNGVDEAFKRIKTSEDMPRVLANLVIAYNDELQRQQERATLVLVGMLDNTVWFAGFGDSGLAYITKDNVQRLLGPASDPGKDAREHLGARKLSEPAIQNQFKTFECSEQSRLLLYTDGLFECFTTIEQRVESSLYRYMQQIQIERFSDDERLRGVIGLISDKRTSVDDLGLIAISVESLADDPKALAKAGAKEALSDVAETFETTLNNLTTKIEFWSQKNAVVESSMARLINDNNRLSQTLDGITRELEHLPQTTSDAIEKVMQQFQMQEAEATPTSPPPQSVHIPEPDTDTMTTPTAKLDTPVEPDPTPDDAAPEPPEPDLAQGAGLELPRRSFLKSFGFWALTVILTAVATLAIMRLLQDDKLVIHLITLNPSSDKTGTSFLHLNASMDRLILDDKDTPFETYKEFMNLGDPPMLLYLDEASLHSKLKALRDKAETTPSYHGMVSKVDAIAKKLNINLVSPTVTPAPATPTPTQTNSTAPETDKAASKGIPEWNSSETFELMYHWIGQNKQLWQSKIERKTVSDLNTEKYKSLDSQKRFIALFAQIYLSQPVPNKEPPLYKKQITAQLDPDTLTAITSFANESSSDQTKLLNAFVEKLFEMKILQKSPGVEGNS